MSRRTGAVRRPGPLGSGELHSGAGPASSAKPVSGTEPLQSYLELGALPGAVPCARLHAKQIIWEWALTGLTDEIELVVSELVTNAQRASASVRGSRYNGRWIPGVPPLRLWLSADSRGVLIQVWDGDNHLPEPQAIDLDAESGRGLLLIETLSTQWGSYIPAHSTGKIVWALCSAIHGLDS